MSPDGQVVFGLDDIEPGASVVTVGNFDGVHLGHQLLLGRTVKAAVDRGVRSVAVTFDPHPTAVVRPGDQPLQLTTLDERIMRMSALGVDLVVVLPFTVEFSRLTPREFVEQVFVERLRAQRIVVGTNFRFGHRAAGDMVMLVEIGDELGFDVEAVALKRASGRQDAARYGAEMSSSAIRAALAQGDVAFASHALGRDFSVRGRVVHGDGRGRTIGVPTANVAVASDVVLPADGVYAGIARWGDHRAPCVTNVGVRPTVTDTHERTVEAHLIDVDVALYDTLIDVSFAHHLRPEQRFDGLDQLVAQIRADVSEARAWLSVHRAPEG